MNTQSNRNIHFNVVNPELKDTANNILSPGDLVMVFNGDRDPSLDKKWSVEKVVMSSEGEICTLFEKYLCDLITPVKGIKSEWLVLIKSYGGPTHIFHNDIFGFKS